MRGYHSSFRHQRCWFGIVGCDKSIPGIFTQGGGDSAGIVALFVAMVYVRFLMKCSYCGQRTAKPYWPVGENQK